jgi:alcohol dehydrogenase
MKMTAAVMFAQGVPRPYAETKPLRIETVDLEGPGTGEVLVEIAGAGLCHSDLSAIEGNRPRAVPTVVGHEAAGIVREVGTDVTRVKRDDHVAMLFVASCGSCDLCQGAGAGDVTKRRAAAEPQGPAVAPLQRNFVLC